MSTLTRQQRDDLVHAINQTVGFYRKTLDPAQIPFWLSAVEGYDPDDVKAALMHHTKVDRREPRPSDLMDFLNERKARKRTAIEPPKHVPCPPEISTAWRWFLALSAGDVLGDSPSRITMGTKAARELDQDTQDRYLRIVNEQARQLGMPDAIPDEYKIAEVWA